MAPAPGGHDGLTKKEGGCGYHDDYRGNIRVFMTAFRALPKRVREAVVGKMLSDKEFLEDLIDTVMIERRRKEPSKILVEYLSDRKKKVDNALFRQIEKIG
jgi:hypothetical protein